MDQRFLLLAACSGEVELEVSYWYMISYIGRYSTTCRKVGRYT